MSNRSIHTQSHYKIESLLLSDDFSFVIQGFELLKTLPSIDFGAFSFSVRWVDDYQYSHFSISRECTHARYVGCAMQGMRLIQDASFTPKKSTTRMHFEGPIPPEIGAFKDLTSLTVSLPYGNDIKEYSIPGEITNLPKLHTLTATLQGAKLRLPENIGSSTSLTKIHLESDTPMVLPVSFGNINTLETLEINHLAGSEICLDGLTSLQSSIFLIIHRVLTVLRYRICSQKPILHSQISNSTIPVLLFLHGYPTYHYNNSI